MTRYHVFIKSLNVNNREIEIKIAEVEEPSRNPARAIRKAKRYVLEGDKSKIEVGVFSPQDLRSLVEADDARFVAIPSTYYNEYYQDEL